MVDALPAKHPPDDELERFLHDAAGNWTAESIISHLDHCESCQSRLESLASDQSEWNDAAEALSSDQWIDDDESGGTIASAEWTTDESIRADRSAKAMALLSPILTPSDDPRMLGRLGRFEILGIVGTGGMGIVVKACDPSLARYVAIKILAPHLASSETARIRFAREAKAAAAVVHDNVIAIYQVDQISDLPFLVMPYLPGPSLEQRISAEGPLTVEASLAIALQVARGLAAAHHQGLVHRDVKPANVLLASGTERAVITDFGLARASDDASITRVGTLAGTPHYMSPEQARGEVVDSRSDLFSLGSLMFAMLTGAPPVPLETGTETIREIATTPMPRLTDANPELPSWLDELIWRLHRTNADDRPTIDETVELIQQCLASIREPARHSIPDSLKPSSQRTTPAPLARRRLWWAIPMLAVAILVGFLVTDPEQTQRRSNAPPAVATPEAAPGSLKTTEGEMRVESDNESLREEETGHATATDPLPTAIPFNEPVSIDPLDEIDQAIQSMTLELLDLEKQLQPLDEGSTR